MATNRSQFSRAKVIDLERSVPTTQMADVDCERWKEPRRRRFRGGVASKLVSLSLSETETIAFLRPIQSSRDNSSFSCFYISVFTRYNVAGNYRAAPRSTVFDLLFHFRCLSYSRKTLTYDTLGFSPVRFFFLLAPSTCK